MSTNIETRTNCKLVCGADILVLPPPVHGQTWGPWRLDAKSLELFYRRNRWTYEIDLEKLTTSAAMLDWIFQVQLKVWCSASDIKHLLEAFHALFRPQATLCSGGFSKTLDATRHLKKLLRM
jgi:hypothetical protein